MGWVITLVGGAASIALIALSMTINWKFGMTLGATVDASVIYGIMGVALDGLKLVMPFAVLWAWRRRRVLSILAACLIWSGCTFLSFSSAVGFAAHNRTKNTEVRTVMAASRQALLDDLSRSQAALTKLGTVRPVGILESEIARLQTHPRWSRTSGCTDATVTPSILFCDSHERLLRELSAGQAAEEISQRIIEIRSELDADAGKPLTAADPQLSVLARLARVEISHVRDIIVVVLAALLELASSFGLFLTMRTQRGAENTGAASQVAPHELEPAQLAPERAATVARTDIEAFLDERIRQVEGARVEAGDVYAAYSAWVIARAEKPLSQTRFGNWLRDNTQLRKANIGGRVRYLNVALEPAEPASSD